MKRRIEKSLFYCYSEEDAPLKGEKCRMEGRVRYELVCCYLLSYGIPKSFS